MKKLIVTAVATLGLALGAYAQGSVTFSDGILHSGIALNTADNYFQGGTSVTITLYYLAGSTLPTAYDINSLNGVNPMAAIAGLTVDGFTQAAQNSVVMSAANSGTFNFGTVTLSGLPEHASTAVIAIEAYTVFNDVTYGGVVDFVNAVGDPNATPIAGTPAQLSGWDAITPQNDPADGAFNLIMTSAPEPTTLALAGLSGLALWLFRRRK